jgi:hypothetical protein
LVGDTEAHIGVVSARFSNFSSVALGLHSTAWVEPDEHLVRWEGHIDDLGDSMEPSELHTVDSNGAEVFGGAMADYFCFRGLMNEYYCWGNNYTFAIPQAPLIAVAPFLVSVANDALDVALGPKHLCGRFRDHVGCALGLGLGTDWTTIGGLGAVSSLSVGAQHTCASMDGLGVFCWGTGEDGQLGVDVKSSETPRQSSPQDVQQVAAGGWTTCALLRSGAVECWGFDGGGQTGAPKTDTPSPVPVRVPGISSVVQIGCGQEHCCAMKSDGTVWCWGANDQNQLATAEVADSNVPLLVKMPAP